MKAIILAFLLITLTSAQVDGCNSDRQYQDDYLRICVSAASSTETDDVVSMRIEYISTAAEVVTTDFVELDDASCDPFERD